MRQLHSKFYAFPLQLFYFLLLSPININLLLRTFILLIIYSKITACSPAILRLFSTYDMNYTFECLHDIRSIRFLASLHV